MHVDTLPIAVVIREIGWYVFYCEYSTVMKSLIGPQVGKRDETGTQNC
jgi:hypothetical protein